MRTLKSLTLAVVASLFMASTMSSCSDEPIAELDGGGEPKSALLDNLKSINNDIIANTPATRGWTALQKSRVVLADIHGAFAGYKYGSDKGKTIGGKFGRPGAGSLIGGLICGAAYGGYRSWEAAPRLKAPLVEKPDYSTSVIPWKNAITTPSLPTDGMLQSNGTTLVLSPELKQKIVVDKKLLSSVNLTEAQLNVGQLHNLLLASFEGKIKAEDIAHSVESNDKLVNAVVCSKEMEDLYNRLVNNGEEETKKELPDKVMDLFYEVFQSSASTCDDVVLLINKYADAIDASDELTKDQKDWVKGGLATALYSMNYWNTPNLNSK